jgi:hypothetical protein
MKSIAEIEAAVFASLRTLTPPGAQIARHHKLVADLKLLGDDTWAHAVDVERSLKIRIPRKEWEQVSTVQDVIGVLAKHRAD